MEVSLKKAHKLQKDLEEIVRRYSVTTSFKVSVYSNIDADSLTTQIMDAQAKLVSDYEKSSEIFRWIYAIRADIGRINHEVGIDTLLNSLALNGKLLSHKGGDTGYAPDVVVLQRKLELTKKRLENVASDSYSSDVDTVTVDLGLNRTDYVKSLRREKVNLEDQLTALNAKTMVKISDDIEAFLKSEGIL